MCITAGKTKNVSKTQIVSFQVNYKISDSLKNSSNKPLRNSCNNKGQLVVYSANIDSASKTNAFILPVYNQKNNVDNIIPLDLSDLENLTIDIYSIFNKWFPKVLYKSVNKKSVEAKNEKLEVYKVGDYKFSVMASKYDFDKLNNSELNIEPAAKVAIDVHDDNFSFIVCQFYKKGKLNVTPFGYLCKSHSKNSMILPTIHGHPPDDNNSKNVKFEDTADFDHKIYTITRSKNKKLCNSEKLNIILSTITKDYRGRNIKISTPKYFIPNEITINGIKNNRNLLCSGEYYDFLNI